MAKAAGMGEQLPRLRELELMRANKFSDNYTPSQLDSQTASARQLRTECYTLTLGSEAVNRKAARLKVLTDRFPGVPVYGGYEPSDSLADLCLRRAFDEAVAYIPWQKCNSRTQEVLHVKKDNILPKSFLKLAADGTVKEAYLVV
eukprot:3888010-Amphidinium_carterae.1